MMLVFVCNFFFWLEITTPHNHIRFYSCFFCVIFFSVTLMMMMRERKKAKNQLLAGFFIFSFTEQLFFSVNIISVRFVWWWWLVREVGRLAGGRIHFQVVFFLSLFDSNSQESGRASENDDDHHHHGFNDNDDDGKVVAIFSVIVLFFFWWIHTYVIFCFVELHKSLFLCI